MFFVNYGVMSLLPLHSYTNTVVAKTFLASLSTQVRPKKRYIQPYVETAEDVDEEEGMSDGELYVE